MSCQAKEIMKMKRLAFALGQEEKAVAFTTVFLIIFFLPIAKYILVENSWPALISVDDYTQFPGRHSHKVWSLGWAQAQFQCSQPLLTRRQLQRFQDTLISSNQCLPAEQYTEITSLRSGFAFPLIWNIISKKMSFNLYSVVKRDVWKFCFSETFNKISIEKYVYVCLFADLTSFVFKQWKTHFF